MKNIYKAVAAVCAMAALMSSVPALPVSADTVTKPMYYAQADMGAATDFNRVNIDFGGSAPDEYTVESSMDGKIWTELTSNVTEKNAAADFSFNEANNCYVYKDYNTRYVRVVSDEDMSKATIKISKTTDIAPEGSSMLFEKNDGTDIKSSTDVVDARLNKKDISACAYIYWGSASPETYDFEEANIIIPLGEEKEISRFEIGSYFNDKTKAFQNFFAKNYEISYINSSTEVHANTEGWKPLKSGNTASGWLTAAFNPVKATHIKFNTNDKGVAGRNNGKIATFLSYIGVYTSAIVPSDMTYGSYDTEVEEVEDMGEVDLVMFMGQSNMAGRGEAADSVVCQSGHGYEFRAISDPAKLYDVREPFGVNENNAASGVNELGSKSGSMVSALMEEYYSYTGVPMVGVSCSKGGSQISFWQPGSPALDDAVSRYKAAKLFLKKNGYTVRRKLMVWCQGESDADVSTPIADYKEMTQNMAQAMIDEGIEKCFMVQIGHKNDTSGKYDPYIEAQSELCAADDRFVMVSEKFADNQASMKDLYHYHQSVYNEVGADAGKNIAAYYGDTTKNLPSTINIIDKLRTNTEAGVTIDGDTDGVVIAALYDKNGALEQSKIVDKIDKATTVKFITSENSKTIKLFNWNSLSEMQPIGESKSININGIDIKTSATTSDFLYGSYEDSTKYEHAMPYRYILPVNYDSSKEYPILMYLHGAGRRGNDNENQLNNPKPLFDRLLSEENINKYPCIIVAPQCPEGEQWVDTPWGKGTYKVSEVPVSDELSMAKDIILDFENRFSVDTDRVYIAGQSMGGYGTWDMIMRNPDMFAAAIPQCAAGDVTQAESLKTMAVWAHHGEIDDTVPLSGSREMVAALKEAGSTNVRYTQYPSISHEVQIETFKEPDLLSWLFSKSLTSNANVKDDYTYLKVNDVLVREYTEENPRPVKQDGKVYVSAEYIASELGMTYENSTMTKGEKSLTLTDGNSITSDGVVMVDSAALAETLGLAREFDEVSNTLSFKANTQRNGALEIKEVTASSRLTDGNEQYAADGKPDTRWTAIVQGAETTNTLTVDLGTIRGVEKASIMFYLGNARKYDFDIEVSTDGSTYTKVKTFTSSGTTNDFEDFVFDQPVNARCVRYVGRGSTVVANSSHNDYNSFWEFEIYGSEEPIEDPNAPQVFKELKINSAEANAESIDSGKGIGYASQAIDGIVTDASRWSAMVTTAKPENTVTFDFGEIRCVSSVDIAFYASSARKYDFDIKVSNDGQKWKKVNTYASDGKTQELKFERFEFEKVNARYIQYCGRGATVNGGGTNPYNSFYEFKAFGYDKADKDAPNAPSFADPNITVVRDDDNTTYDSIGLTWTYDGEAEDAPKYYRVQRVMDGVVEFETDGEVSTTSYVDKGSAQRPQYGPYEADYSQQDNGRYYISDLNDTTKSLSDAGDTTKIYEAYEGIPLVSGGEYGYIVKGYNAAGEVVAQSALTPLKTMEKENTASLVFSGEPSTELEGYNMSVSYVNNMSRVDGILDQNDRTKVLTKSSCWNFNPKTGDNITTSDILNSNLGLKFDDKSGLMNAEEDNWYLLKITWGAEFFNPSSTIRMNLQRTANTTGYNPELNAVKPANANSDYWKNFLQLESGSMARNHKWYTREVAYCGKNSHSINVNDVLSDIAINSYPSGMYGHVYIKSIEISQWDGPEERPFEIHMPSMFTDNMIIQRDKEINIWGRLDGTPRNDDKTYKSATVTAILKDEGGAEVASNTATSAATRAGDWTITLPEQSYQVDKTYTLELTATAGDATSKTTTISNIIFGDVYLCAGQSNMRYGYEYPYWTDYHNDVDSGLLDNENIRIISNENNTVSNYWETDTVGWKQSNTQSIQDLKFSATASYFGKHLYGDNGHIPIGLISSAVGGASIETFLVNQVDNGNGAQFGNSALYKRLIYPYTNWENSETGKGIQLAGVIWYQGEADANSSKITMPAYTKAMESMVSDYRTVFNDDSLPFMYVQLAAFDNPGGEYAAMREAQFNYMIGKNTTNGKPENVGMAVITDNTDNIKDIHPRNKSEVGRRLSLWARKLVYNEENLEYTGPIFKAVEQVTTEDGTKALKITFEDYSVMNGLKLKDNTLVGMTLAGDDKEFKTVSGYELADDNKSIIVWSDDISEPKYVNYGYYKLPTDATLFNNDDLPASAFRNYED